MDDLPIPTDLAIHTWGTGVTAVLVHGSLATGREEWQAQQPLTDEGFRLCVPDRRGYGASPARDGQEGEDFLLDAADIAELVADGAHVVAHSYGGLGAMFAAARRPAAVRSLALLEPAAFTPTSDHGAARDLVEAIRSLSDDDRPDDVWLLGFLEAVGTDPADLPDEVLDEAIPLVPLLRRGRPPWDHELPIDELAGAPFPKLVVSGGHSDGFEAVCDELAERIGASRLVVEGAGHEIQFTGPPINAALLDLWSNAA